jgi:hypothetical protein
VRPEQRSAHNISNKNHETLESTFLTLLVGHLNERIPMPRFGHAIRRGLTPIGVGFGQVRDLDDGRHHRNRAKIRMPAAGNWNLIAPSLWG